MRILIFIICLTLAFWLASCSNTSTTANKTESIDSNLFYTYVYGYDVYMKTIVDNQGCTWVLAINNSAGASLQMQHSPCCKNPNHAK